MFAENPTEKGQDVLDEFLQAVVQAEEEENDTSSRKGAKICGIASESMGVRFLEKKCVFCQKAYFLPTKSKEVGCWWEYWA